MGEQLKPRYLEDIKVGEDLSEIAKGPMTAMHVMRWSAAIENWHRIHYDRPFAVEHDGLPDVLVNGSWKQHVLAQLVKDWAGPSGWLHKLEFRYLSMDARGATVTAFGTVEAIEAEVDWGRVYCKVGLRNELEQVTTEGQAEVLVPFRAGPAIPYPLPGGGVPSRRPSLARKE